MKDCRWTHIQSKESYGIKDAAPFFEPDYLKKKYCRIVLITIRMGVTLFPTDFGVYIIGGVTSAGFTRTVYKVSY